MLTGRYIVLIEDDALMGNSLLQRLELGCVRLGLPLPDRDELRARVEHPFRILKRQFGYTKVRYRGLAKNTAQLFSLFALANLVQTKDRILSQGVIAP